MHSSQHRRLAVLAVAVSLAALACSKEGDAPASTAQPLTTTPAATGDVQPDPGRQIVTVEMVTDERGNYYAPAGVNVRKGDVVRFTLKSGVHNVHFLPDSNSQKIGLPKASDMLQLPGQTYDLKVTLDAGSYYFQCDPHAMLGMIGRLHVAGE